MHDAGWQRADVLPQDGVAVFVGRAVVNHGRQPQFRGEFKLPREGPRLVRARRVLVEIVQPGLAEGDDARLFRKFAQGRQRRRVRILRLIRMQTHRRENPVPRQRQRLPAVLERIPDNDKPVEPVQRAREYRLPVFTELAALQVAVCVDQRHGGVQFLEPPPLRRLPPRRFPRLRALLLDCSSPPSAVSCPCGEPDAPAS